MRVEPLIRALILLSLGSTLCEAQQTQQSVALTAVLRPSIQLSEQSIALSFRVTDAVCEEMSSSLDISWNVDRWTKQIQIIASFTDATSALSETRGHAIPASTVEARFKNSTWKTFPETRSGVESSSLLLDTINTLEFGRRAYRHTQLQFRVCGQRTECEGNLRGWVTLRAVMQ
jgi:hypothetical protein